jgi:hypothetical protein
MRYDNYQTKYILVFESYSYSETKEETQELLLVTSCSYIQMCRHVLWQNTMRALKTILHTQNKNRSACSLVRSDLRLRKRSMQRKDKGNENMNFKWTTIGWKSESKTFYVEIYHCATNIPIFTQSTQYLSNCPIFEFQLQPHIGTRSQLVAYFWGAWVRISERRTLGLPWWGSHGLHKGKQKTPWPESARELYRQRDRHLSSKIVPTFADRACRVVSAEDPLRP